MKANDAKRLKELEVENARLKKLLAEAELDKSMLKEVCTNRGNAPGWLRETFDPRSTLQGRCGPADRFGVSQRRACRVVGQPRSTQRRPRPVISPEEAKLRRRLQAIARAKPRAGYKTAYRLLRREGWTVNHKRVQRLWREEGLRRPASRRRKRTRPPGGGPLLRAVAPNDVWALDFQFDETTDGRRLKLLNIADEFTREALAMRVGRTCTADEVVAVLDRLVTERGAPRHLRCDNGPELIAWALRDYCRLAVTHIAYIEPGSPWQNPFIESFNSRVRDEHLNLEAFGSLMEAQVLTEAWGVEYNTWRPHGSLGGLTPAEYHRQWTHNQLVLS